MSKAPNSSFRGANEASVCRLSLNSSALSYSLCNHEWSFLEGEKKHSHTLKAGRHLFPFQLQIGGSLPSSTGTSVFGGAMVMYKLRAIAVRPGLSHNWQALAPVTILRSFSSEALEYQQTLEIENTWPEKLMYSVMVPHKAWAIGDKLTALAKFSPLSKGARVINVTAAIHETTKLFGPKGCQENTRIVSTARHEIVGHNAVLLEEHRGFSPRAGTHSAASTPGLHTGQRNTNTSSVSGYFNQPSTSPSGPSISSPSVSEAGPSNSAVESNFDPTLPEDQQLNTDDVVTHLSIPIPLTAVPTHTLEPIVVSHRIRWSILIGNLDGHTSELRCSLPLHILDHRLLHESRVYTSTTRRLLLGGPEISEEDRDEMELPSYRAHVYDRVANMYMPDGATMRVTNPLVNQSNVQSGASTPLEVHPLASHLPHAPGSGNSTPLDWVNSELLLSMSSEEPRPQRISPPHSNGRSHPTSRPESSRASRRQSRAPSPDRHHHHSPHTPPTPTDTIVHGANHASRDIQGLFQVSMKPLSSTSSWLPSRSTSHGNLTSLVSTGLATSSTDHHSYHQSYSPYNHSPTPGNQETTTTHTDAQAGVEAMHRAFTEVPDYAAASRGFIGGVPPLTSLRDLPSYDEAERSHSETSVAAHFTRAMRLSRSAPSTPPII